MKLFVANWKMNLEVGESEKLARACVQKLPKPGVTVVLCPSHPSISKVSSVVKGSSYKLGAQDCAIEDRGAFTGEVSAKDLYQLGCRYVILGHSERRAMGETDEQIRGKYMAAIRNKIQPILCVGETLIERRRKLAAKVVSRQLNFVFQSLQTTKDFQPIIAYEPIWAVGTGNPATPKDAYQMHSLIKKIIGEKFNRKKVLMLYGGSVDLQNVYSFLSTSEVAGVLVGGASAKPTLPELIQSASIDKKR